MIALTSPQSDKNSANDRAFRDLKFHSDGTIRSPGKKLLPPTAIDRIGNGLMHYAVMHNRIDVITQLSHRNVPLNQKNHLELTPFALACIMADAELLHFIAKQIKPEELCFKMPPREALTLAPIKYRSSAQERLKQAFEYFEPGQVVSAMQFCAAARDSACILAMMKFPADYSLNVGKLGLIDHLAWKSDRAVMAKLISLTSAEELKTLSKASTNIPLEVLFSKSGQPVDGVAGEVVKAREGAWIVALLRNSGAATLLEFAKKVPLTIQAVSPYIFDPLAEASGQSGKPTPGVTHISSAREAFNVVIRVIAGKSSGCLQVSTTVENQEERKVTEKYIKACSVLSDFSEVAQRIQKLDPMLASDLNGVIRDNKITNQSFAIVCAMALRLYASVVTESSHVDLDAVARIICASMQERRYIQQPWPQYVDQKIYANRYKIDGFRDVFVEFKNAVIAPCLLNALLKQGVGLREIVDQEANLENLISEVAVRHVFWHKSIGSLFRFNSAWHREDMRLPDAQCADLDSRRWFPIIPNGAVEVLPGYRVVDLVTGTQLEQEGQVMKHCVRGRAAQCVKGEVHIFSIRHQSQSIATIDVRVRNKGASKAQIDVFEFQGPGNTTPSAEAKAAWAAFNKMLADDELVLDARKVGQINPNDSLDAAEQWFLTKSFVKPGVHPAKAIAHYVALKIMMNRSTDIKWFLGGFHDDEFDFEQQLLADVDRVLPKALKLFGVISSGSNLDSLTQNTSQGVAA